MNLLFYLFTLEQLREEACDCLFEIISKRMGRAFFPCSSEDRITKSTAEDPDPETPF